MSNPGTKKFKVAKDTSQEISPAMLGQTSVQIEISCHKKEENVISMVATYLVLAQSQ